MIRSIQQFSVNNKTFGKSIIALAISIIPFAHNNTTHADTINVNKGATLSSIAAKYSTSPEEIAKTNGISNINLIKANSKINIPTQQKTYVVEKGDTLSTIAKKFNISVSKLAQINHLNNVNLIFTGQELNTSSNVTDVANSPIVSRGAQVRTLTSRTTTPQKAIVKTISRNVNVAATPVQKEAVAVATTPKVIPATAQTNANVGSAKTHQTIAVKQAVNTAMTHSAQQIVKAQTPVQTTTSVVTTPAKQQVIVAKKQAITPAAAPVQTHAQTQAPAAASGGSTYNQFIAAGGTQSMWNTIVMPESTGNPNASNGQYHGLGQTAQSWGYGSVANQTRGMINYAVSRYGSVGAALQFRQAHNWW